MSSKMAYNTQLQHSFECDSSRCVEFSGDEYLKFVELSVFKAIVISIA